MQEQQTKTVKDERTPEKDTEGILCIQDMTDQAKNIAKAIGELMHFDAALDADSMRSENTYTILEAREVLRNHSTCSGLLAALVSLCERIENALDIMYDSCKGGEDA